MNSKNKMCRLSTNNKKHLRQACSAVSGAQWHQYIKNAIPNNQSVLLYPTAVRGAIYIGLLLDCQWIL